MMSLPKKIIVYTTPNHKSTHVFFEEFINPKLSCDDKWKPFPSVVTEIEWKLEVEDAKH